MTWLWLVLKVLGAWCVVSGLTMVIWIGVMKCRGALTWDEWPELPEPEGDEWTETEKRHTEALQKAVGE